MQCPIITVLASTTVDLYFLHNFHLLKCPKKVNHYNSNLKNIKLLKLITMKKTKKQCQYINNVSLI